MLNVVKERNAVSVIACKRCAMENLELPDESVDVVLSLLALVGKIAHWLAPGREVVFSVEHPTFTAYGSQDWVYNAEGSIAHFPVDRYCIKGVRGAVFLGETITKYPRTLTTYPGAPMRAGLVLRAVAEPRPLKEMLTFPACAASCAVP